MLCAVMLSLERWGYTQYVIARIDQQEAGVSMNAIETWWHEHKIQDAERRVREAQAMEAQRKEIIDRLTPEERQILGIG
jgi:hypothetical protein